MPYVDRKTAGAWIRLPATVRRELERRAAASGRPLSAVALEAIEAGIAATSDPGVPGPVLVSELALRRVFPGWRAAYDESATGVWHAGYLDSEGMIDMPHVGTAVAAELLHRGEMRRPVDPAE